MHKKTEADCGPFRFLVNFLAFQYLAIQVVSCSDGFSQSGSCVHSWVTSGCALHFPVGDLYKLFCKHKDDLISWLQIIFSEVSHGLCFASAAIM